MGQDEYAIGMLKEGCEAKTAQSCRGIYSWASTLHQRRLRKSGPLSLLLPFYLLLRCGSVSMTGSSLGVSRSTFARHGVIVFLGLARRHMDNQPSFVPADHQTATGDVTAVLWISI
jgi:hypothetical protein